MDSAKVFTARTRKRNEVPFYLAKWVEKPYMDGGYEVEFLDGPHKGKRFTAINVAKAPDYMQQKLRRGKRK